MDLPNFSMRRLRINSPCSCPGTPFLQISGKIPGAGEPIEI
jgi:hypothetical protein